MATTIKLKNGSGAPLAGDLVQGEPALDLTNKRLYTEDSGGSVIEVGTNPTSLTVSGDLAVDTDTLFVDVSAGNVGIGTAAPDRSLHVSGAASAYMRLESLDTTGSVAQVVGAIEFEGNDSGGAGVRANVNAVYEGTSGATALTFGTSVDAGSATERMRIDRSGNVGIGTDTPANNSLTIDKTGTARLRLAENGVRSWDMEATGGDWRLNNASNSIEAIRVDLNGNVGIGTTSPESDLHVNGKIQLANNSAIGLDIINTVSAIPAAQNHGYIATANSGAGGANGDLLIAPRTTALTNIRFVTGTIPTERMRIDSSGNVGIGTNSPSLPLEVDGVIESNAATNGVRVRRGSTGYYGEISVNYVSSKVETYIDSIAGPSFGGEHVFRSSSGGGAVTERMRIDSSGNLLLGTTDPSPNGQSVNAKFVVDHASNVWGVHLAAQVTSLQYQIVFTNPNGNVGRIETSGSTTTYVTSSDVRLKENIVDAPSASDDIDAIQIRSYDWKADGQHQKYGVVAQELVNVAPEAVSQGATEDDTWGVDYSKLVPMLVKEIQDLRARVAQLEEA